MLVLSPVFELYEIMDGITQLNDVSDICPPYIPVMS